jgi:MFS family permease
LFFIPAAALGLALIPVAPQLIPPALSGQVQAMGGLFTLFILSLLVMLISMAIWRTPIFALMADVTPSARRSHANGVLNLMAGVGGVVAFILGSLLYKVHPVLPFWMAALCMLVALVLLINKVREPSPESASPESSTPDDLAGNISLSVVLNSFRQLPTDHHRPLILLAIAVFCYMMGFHPIEAFFSSYGVNVLGLSESDTGLVLATAYITFILFAIPSAMIAWKIGRRRTMQTGLVLFTIVMAVAFFTPVVSIMVVLLGLGGLAWALIDINGLPMILDVTHTNHQAGTYAGIYFAATTLAAIAGPVINGLLIDLTGRNYNMIFVIGPIFFIISLLTLTGVHDGEAYA